MRVTLAALLLSGGAIAIWNMPTAPEPARQAPPFLAPSRPYPAFSVVPTSPVVVSTVYERQRHSADPAERARAYRLWSTCAPRLGGASTLERGPDRFIAALPEAANRSQRQAALGAIDALCRTMIGVPTAAVLAVESRQLEFDAAHGAATSPALEIKLALDQGDRAKALVLLQSALQAHDPESLLELSMADLDLFSEPDLQDQARLRRAALALLACDGDPAGACDQRSFIALRLCAFQALCEGTISERIIPMLGYSDAELRASADLLRLLIGKGDNSALQYLTGG